MAQRTWLFSGTIASNLRLASPSASDDELWAALQYAHLAQEVHRMPEGLYTNVGERGQFLSGGQAQRISIARAFLSRRKIWLLDEPTAQVDAVSEEEIIKALAELPRDITLIVITHRPSLLTLVDRIYELTDGKMHRIDAHQASMRVEAEQ
ncbi:ABC transporter ATP-binding protein [Chlamydia trachomatis]|nr:ABC transporter ATP-binding protein [Chlamydia trachomatis]